MTIERGGRSTSPVHVHVDSETPVHVHVKKPGKTSGGQSTVSSPQGFSDSKPRSVSAHGPRHVRRSTATARSKGKSPTGPWVPPPARTSKSSKYSWQGASHRLEIAGQDENPLLALHNGDLSTDEEGKVQSDMRKYEKKIDGLMAEVGTLKNEVTLQRTVKELEKKDDELDKSRLYLERQEHELEEFRRELEDTEAENRLLRRSFEMSSSKCGEWSCDREQLMKKLVEVEMDGQAAAKQAAALKDATRRLKEMKRMSTADATMLTKQKDLLLDRIVDFEASNRMLRKMLRDRHEQEADNLCLAEQRDMLLKKLSETEDCLQRMRSGILDKDETLNNIKCQAEAQRDENVVLANLQASLESTRAHLQKQLRQKEGDCNRLAVQVRTLESQLVQEKIDVDHLTGLLTQAKHKSDHDKDALKKATRVQKQRASRSEDALEQLSAQILERDTHIAELRADLENNQSHYDKINKEKAQLLHENIALKTRMAELENIMLSVEDNSKAQVETLTTRLHTKTSEASGTKLENERLKTSLVTIEDKLTQADNEMAQLRSSLRQYETLIDEYRSQMNKSRREADETMTMLDHQKMENKRLGKEGDSELEKVKYRLQSRLVELEPIPELLRTTELKLQDASERISTYDRRNTENTKLIAELTAKVETQANQMGFLHDKLHGLQDTSRSSSSRQEFMERKLKELEERNCDLLKTIARLEETVHQANMRLDEKTRENVGLNRQLESMLEDARRVTECSRDKATAKDRSMQSRILDLEAQLSQTRAEIARIKREKDEAERKFNSRLYDVKDRLEQAHATNRSMQNYVQFLKNSYANVFGEQNLTACSSQHQTYY